MTMGAQIGSSGLARLQPRSRAHLLNATACYRIPPTMTQKWRIVLSLFAIFLPGCSDVERDGLKTWISEVSEPAIVQVEQFGATQIARVKGTIAPRIATRAVEIVGTEAAELKETAVPWIATEAAEVMVTWVADQRQNAFLERAQTWVDGQVPYDPGETHDGFRTDGSGYVSYAWWLDPPGLEPTAFAGDAYTLHIPIEQLQPGDALNNEREEGAGHVVLFVRWLDEEYTRFEAYDLSPGTRASIRELTLDLADTGWTIAELDSFAPGPYYSQRLKENP